jgi:hypothetical protein
VKSRKKIFFVPVHLFGFFYNIRVCAVFVGKRVDRLKIIPNTYCGLLYKRPFSNAFVILNPLCCFYGFTGSRNCFPKRKQAIPMKRSPSNYDRFEFPLASKPGFVLKGFCPLHLPWLFTAFKIRSLWLVAFS